MIIEIIRKIGEEPLVLSISQFVVRQDNGTPIAVGAEYGPDNAQAVSMYDHEDFPRILRLLGIKSTVIVKTIKKQPDPDGARLLLKPP